MSKNKRARLVEGAAPDLVDDQARGLDERGHRLEVLPELGGFQLNDTKLGRLEVVCLEAPPGNTLCRRLAQGGSSQFHSFDERKVLPCVQVR